MRLVTVCALLCIAGSVAANEPAPRSTLKQGAAPRAAAAPARPSPPDSATVVALLEGVSNVSCPVPGIATGGQIRASHVERLKRAGFRSVLDTRGESEPRGFDEALALKRSGLAYINLPVTSETLGDATFERARQLLGDAKLHPMLAHCGSGNRVGVVMLPWLVLDRGWTLDAAIAAAEKAGMRASPMREQALDYVKRHRAK